METRRLDYFLALARELHFGRAAAELHVSQSALSQQIKLLERELGASLVRRSTREVALTSLGEQVAAQAQELETATNRVREKIADLLAGNRGRLCLGFVPSAAFGILPGLVAPYSQSHPAVELVLREAPSMDQVRQVISRELDLGVVRDLNDTYEGTTQTPLLTERLVLACPVAHPAASSSTVSLDDLRGERFIVLPPAAAPGLSHVVHSLCLEAAVSLNDALHVLAYPTTLGLIASGMGVAIVPATVQATQMPGLAFRALSQDNAVSRIALISRDDNQNPLAKRFIELSSTSVWGTTAVTPN